MFLIFPLPCLYYVLQYHWDTVLASQSKFCNTRIPWTFQSIIKEAVVYLARDTQSQGKAVQTPSGKPPKLFVSFLIQVYLIIYLLTSITALIKIKIIFPERLAVELSLKLILTQ